MMLLDASIIVDFVHNYQGKEGTSFLDWQRCLCARSAPLVARDLMVMENQIPFQVLKLLICLKCEEGAHLFEVRGRRRSCIVSSKFFHAVVNRLANLEKVVEMFKEMDTVGLHNQDIFKDVKMRIEEHCRSKARTLIPELIYTRFRSPWTAIA